jgi:hypothetical protein
MADDVKKTAEELAKEAAPTESKPETPATTDEVLKAKKVVAPVEEEEEEEDDEKSKKPPFMKGKGKEKVAAKKADDNDFLSSLTEEARTRVESIFKAHADLAAQAEQIKKAQEETSRELAAERDTRKLEQAIQKAAVEYPNLPIDSKVLGSTVKKAEESFTKEQADDFKRVLKAADNAIAESKAFNEANGKSFSYGDTASVLSRLKEVAKGLVQKSENGKPMTEAMAFAKAVELNPGLYNEYLAEQRGSGKMAYEIPGFKFSLRAGADLSLSQYRFVKLNASGDAVVCAAITDKPVGVLQNDPGLGEEAEILVTGITKLSADGIIAIAAELGTSADGQADSIVSGTDTTVFKVGQALEAAAAAGVLIAALVDCLAPSRAA